MEYIKIGGIRIEKTASLAPMASVADRAYRLIHKSFGAAMVTGEMASAKGIVFGDKKSAELLSCDDGERIMAVQLFGSEPEFMAKAAKRAMDFSPDMIDINCGCPVPKVAGNGAGSALMKDPELIGNIVYAVCDAVSVPVTVKIRSGWDEAHISAVEAAKTAEKNGAAAVAVHARTKTQMYSGKADLDVIKAVKQAVKIPVIGNGDVTDVRSCVEMYEKTGCDLVMIGRGSQGKPWVFEQIRHYFETGELLPDPDVYEQTEIMIRHIELLCSLKGEYIGMKEARKHTAWYLKGRPNAARYRAACGRLSSKEDFYDLVGQIKENQ